jgi:hypothetical protein
MDREFFPSEAECEFLYIIKWMPIIKELIKNEEG